MGCGVPLFEAGVPRQSTEAPLRELSRAFQSASLKVHGLEAASGGEDREQVWGGYHSPGRCEEKSHQLCPGGSTKLPQTGPFSWALRIEESATGRLLRMGSLAEAGK